MVTAEQFDVGKGAGRLRESVTIQQPTPTTAASGQDIDAWSTYATRRADVRGARMGNELVDEYQRNGLTPWTVVMRNDSLTQAILPTYRVVWRTLTLHISGIQFKGRYVLLTCTQDMEA